MYDIVTIEHALIEPIYNINNPGGGFRAAKGAGLKQGLEFRGASL